MGPDGIATLIYEDALNQTLMKARGPLANDSFETSVLMSADGKEMDGWYPVRGTGQSPERPESVVHLAFASGRNSAFMYAEISADPTVLPQGGEDRLSCGDLYSNVRLRHGKPHIFYLDSLFGRIKHAWLA